MKRSLGRTLALLLIFGLFILGTAAAAEDLETAAYNGDKEKVIRILKTKPNPDHRDNFGGTALHGAMFQKDLSIVVILLDYGFDPNAKGTWNGYTPLHDAVWASNLEAVKLLLQRGSDPGIKNNDGLTPYEFAAKHGKNQIAAYIKAYAEKNRKKYR
jgi:ankyrin repeat protein